MNARELFLNYFLEKDSVTEVITLRNIITVVYLLAASGAHSLHQTGSETQIP